MPELRPPRPTLEPLLRARSVAVVGASGTPGTFGHALFRQAIDRGRGGAVYPVNPGRTEIDGVRCLSSLAEVPERVDCALLAVADERLEVALQSVAEAGIPATVVFGGADLHPNERARLNPVPLQAPLPDRLRHIANQSQIALLGGNAMGFYNCVDGLFVSGYPPAVPLVAGGIALISHSGSAFSAFANNRRGLRFSYLISPGRELILTTADFVRFLVEQPETRVVALFLEAVRDPAGFVAALEEASRHEIPVVALKVGRSRPGPAMALAHSGALAGSEEAFTALCERWGVIQVSTLDEMADTLELLAAPRRVRGGGLALAGDSGGERALIADRAAAFGVPWAALSAETMATIGNALDPGLEAANPLDLWGSGHSWQRVYATCLTAMADDSASGIVVLAVDLVGGSRLVPGYLDVVERVHRCTELPVAVMGNLATAIDPAAASRLREGGIPVLMGTDTALAALGHALRWKQAAPLATLDAASLALSAKWREVLAGRPQALDESEGKCLLADWGIPVVPEQLVESAEDALVAARVLGWPVVLKTAAPGILHKSNVGGVRLGLTDEAAVVAAYGELRATFGPRAVVQRHVAAKETIELFLGMTNDPQFGPLVSVGLGGIWVEFLRDVATVVPPIDAERAATLLRRLRGFPLVQGVRGAPPVALDPICQAVAAFSRMAAALGSVLQAVDVNPLLAGPHGVVAVDALVVPR